MIKKPGLIIKNPEKNKIQKYKEYRTLDGKEVKIYDIHENNNDYYPVHGAIKIDENNWRVEVWTEEGYVLHTSQGRYDHPYNLVEIEDDFDSQPIENNKEYWAKYLISKGWSTYYNNDYWVNPKLVNDHKSKDFTNYGMTLKEAVAYEILNSEDF